MDPMAKVMFIMTALTFGVLFIARVLDFFLRKFFQKSRLQSKEAEHLLTDEIERQLQEIRAKNRQRETLPPPMPAPWDNTKGEVLSSVAQNAEAKQAEDKVYREPGTLLKNQIEAYRAEAEARTRAANYALKRRQEEAQIRHAEEQAYLKQAKIPGTQVQGVQVRLTPGKMREAVVLAEILGKPKAYRHGRR